MTDRGVIGRLVRAVAPRLALRRAQARFQLDMAERYKGASRRRSGGRGQVFLFASGTGMMHPWPDLSG